jgi:hypothetical protein
MKSLTRPLGLVVTLALVVLTGVGHAQEKKDPPPPKKPTVMQRKLAHAQKVLEGVATEDFDKVAKNAEELKGCVKDATWRIIETEKYVAFSMDFMGHLDSIQAAAKKKNADAAALAYVEMTLTCVKCHQHIRDVRGDAPPLALPSTPRGGE